MPWTHPNGNVGATRLELDLTLGPMVMLNSADLYPLGLFTSLRLIHRKGSHLGRPPAPNTVSAMATHSPAGLGGRTWLLR